MDPFRIDSAYDAANADPGTRSRYGNYIRLNIGEFTQIAHEGWDDPTALFAAAAWRIATSPVMAPGFVRTHPRILGAAVSRGGWDGGLTADVELATAPPAALTRAAAGYGDSWYGWPLDRKGLSEQDVAARPYMLTTTRLLWTLPADAVTRVALPDGLAPARADFVTSLARHCVAELVQALNRKVRPVLEALEA